MLRRFGTIFDKKEMTTQFQQEKDKLDMLVENSTVNLLTIKTVFPLDFFPDELIIDPLKINYINNTFFLSQEVKSILIENTGHVVVSNGPIFATLTVVDSIFSANTITMKPLFKKDALKAQSILQGLILSKKEKIDTAKVASIQGEPSQIEKLGTTPQN